MVLGVLIFVDDYFNCLTVGSVMRPVTDRHKVSRAKLAFLIDATAAPVCIIAPVSSWAAAVTSSVPEGADINGFSMFLKTIPYNFYALSMLLMVVLITVLKTDFGPMRIHEENALKGDLFTTSAIPYGDADDEPVTPHGKVIDLVFPIIVLIICCIIGMVYTGGFFSGETFIAAFSNADASKGLVLGSLVTLIITFCFYMTRGVMSFKTFTECIPEGFKAMVAPILILTMAWTLSGAVCGDHCSPISDTTIMASAGAHSDHVNHVSTQLPYALVAASVSFIGYLIAGAIGYTTESSLALIAMPITLMIMVITILLIKRINCRKYSSQE